MNIPTTRPVSTALHRAPRWTPPRGTAWLPLLVLLLVPLLLVLPANALTRSEVEKHLTCYACPGEPLNIDSCSGGDRMRAEIDRRLALGQDKETILAFFVQQFGEGILTTPPKKGFNLVAYAAPFVALAIGLVIAGLLVRRWAAAATGSTGRGQEVATDLPPADYQRLRERVDREVNQLEDDA